MGESVPKAFAAVPALKADGETREKADVAEITGLLPQSLLSEWPVGMRVIVRRERPHPGAQLSLFEEADGWRYQAFATNTTVGALQFLEARHRAHARVEDWIRHAKDTGLGRLPSREYAINTAWLAAVAIAADLVENFQFTIPKDKPEIIRVPAGIMGPMVKGKMREGMQMPLHVTAL